MVLRSIPRPLSRTRMSSHSGRYSTPVFERRAARKVRRHLPDGCLRLETHPRQSLQRIMQVPRDALALAFVKPHNEFSMDSLAIDAPEGCLLNLAAQSSRLNANPPPILQSTMVYSPPIAEPAPRQSPLTISERNQVLRSVSSIQVSIRLAVATSLWRAHISCVLRKNLVS